MGFTQMGQSEQGRKKIPTSSMRRASPSLDTSAFNCFKIRKTQPSASSHPLSWGASRVVRMRGDSKVSSELREASIILRRFKFVDQRGVNTLFEGGRISFARSSTGTSDVLIDGHSVEEIASTHFIVNKPPGVSVNATSGTASVSSLLPFPSMFSGYSSPLERASSGLVLLLNDIELGKRVESTKPLRTFRVSVSGPPLSPTKIASLQRSIPFSQFEITPLSLGDEDASNILTPIGGARWFTIITRDSRPHLMRTIFSSVGVSLDTCVLESIGGLSLDSLGIHDPGQVKQVTVEQIHQLL